MTGEDFKSKLTAYNERGNDYRYTLTREEAQEIVDALNRKSLVEEIRKLLKEEQEKENITRLVLEKDEIARFLDRIANENNANLNLETENGKKYTLIGNQITDFLNKNANTSR